MFEALLSGEISQEDYFYLNNVTLLFLPLPRKVYGFIFHYKSRNIITVNKYISDYNKKKTIIHELAHLELSHLNRKKQLFELKIQDLEDEADKYVEYLMKTC